MAHEFIGANVLGQNNVPCAVQLVVNYLVGRVVGTADDMSALQACLATESEASKNVQEAKSIAASIVRRVDVDMTRALGALACCSRWLHAVLQWDAIDCVLAAYMLMNRPRRVFDERWECSFKTTSANDSDESELTNDSEEGEWGMTVARLQRIIDGVAAVPFVGGPLHVGQCGEISMVFTRRCQALESRARYAERGYDADTAIRLSSFEHFHDTALWGSDSLPWNEYFERATAQGKMDKHLSLRSSGHPYFVLSKGCLPMHVFVAMMESLERAGYTIVEHNCLTRTRRRANERAHPFNAQ